MNNTIVASFFHKHWNVTCHRCIIHTLMSVYWMLSSTNRHTPALLIFKLKTCSLQSLYVLYACLHLLYIFPFRYTHTHSHTHMQNQLASNCSRTVYNDSTCQVWSCRVKPHRVQWPLGFWSHLSLTNGQRWQWISRVGGCLTYHSTSRHEHSHWVCLQAALLSQFSSNLLTLSSFSVSLLSYHL